MSEGGEAESGIDSAPLSWEGDYPILKNRIVLLGLLAAFGFGILLLFLIMTGIAVAAGDFDRLPGMVVITGFIGGIMVVLVLFSMLLLGGKVEMRVEVTGETVTQAVISRRVRWASSLAILAGLLGGGRGVTTAGAGMIAKSREAETVRLRDLREAVGNPSTGEIRLRNESRTVMQLFAPKDRYEEILERIREAIAAGATGEERRDIPDLVKLGVVMGALVFGVYLLVPFPLGFSGLFVVPMVVLTIAMVTVKNQGARPAIGWILAGGIAVSVLALFLADPPDWNREGIGMALFLQLSVIGLFFVAGVLGGAKRFNRRDTPEC